jgi:tape measure domain-containing protein
MAGIHFDITGDNSNFLRRLREVENGVKNTSKQIEQSGLGIEELFNRMTKAAAAFGAGFTAKELISNIVQVRGEFQQLEVAFKTMLGSEDKANSLMQQLVKTAATTPFDLQGVANGAKQLLAYGEDVEKVNDDLIRLGNIAAGLSMPLGDIVYLYGTTMTQGRLYTQDLNQFTGRGIPMIRELAKQFGVAENEVKGLVEAGKVGFPEVQKVIMSLTDEGGMFFNLMQEQSKTITGQISNIEDSISTMFNEIGKANEGIINDALSGVSYLVENYEKVGNILLEIVGTYGVYRTSLMVTTALQSVQASGITALTAKEAIHYGWLVLTKKAQDALNLSMLKNPYVLAAAAITGLAYGIYKLATAESDTEKAIRETNDALESQKSHYEEIKSKADGLTSTISNESKSIEERFIAYRQLQRLMPDVFKDMDWETAKRKTNAELIKLETDELLRQQRIGLKTKVVMSQQKIQGLENNIIKTTNTGGYTGALKEDLSAAKKELELYQNALNDLEKAKEEAKKENSKPIIYNKKYWEDKKKEAEDARNALDVSQENSDEWNKYTKQILDAQEQISKYSDPSKQGRQTQKEATSQLKQQEKLSEELLSIRRKNQQDEINLMEDGTEKKLAQIDLDYQKELDAIDKQRKEWEKAQNGKLTDEQESDLSAWEENAYKSYGKGVKDASKEKLESERKAWQEYFIEFGNYQEKRKNLIQKYNDEFAKLQKDSPEYAIKEAEKSKAIEQLDEQYVKSTKAMADLFEDASNKSVSAIQSIIDKYETLVKYMSGTKESDGTNVTLDELKALGFTDKDIEKIEKGEISIKDVTDAIKGLKDELKGKSPWQAFVSDLEKGIEAIKKGGNDSKKIGQGITDIGNAVTSFAPALNEFGTDIANIFGIDDSKITKAIEALGGLGQTAAGVGQIMSGDIVGGAMSAVSGISTVVSALDGMFGADYSHYNEMVEEYNKLNEIWDELIDKKLEYINTSYGAEADKVGKEALELVNKSIEAYRILGRERLNSGASVGSHSIGKRMAKNTSSSDWQDISRALDMSVKDAKDFIGTGRMTGLFDLTTEQLEKLKSEAPTFWAKLDGDVRDYLDKIIEGEERIEEIHNQINEQLTQTTFDSVYSNFIDTLMDMKASSKDAAEDISEYFMQAMLSEQIGTLYQDKLKKWYEKFAKGMEDGSLTESERNALNNEYMGYIEEAMKLRDELAAATGYDKISQESTSQSSTSRGFGTEMTHEDAGELSGRFTALQIAGEEIKNQMINAVVGLNSLVSISTSSNATLSSILEQHVKTNGYLEDIVKYTKPILDFESKFDRMITILNNGL